MEEVNEGKGIKGDISTNLIVENTYFSSKGVKCAGVLYRPINIDSPPVVIMAHGFGAEMSYGLPAFAQRFAENGLAVFLFDYRCFGKSDGHPRNLVSPSRHLQDWQAAIKYVQTLPGIDTENIALWGTSFSGGHVIVMATKNRNIKAIVLQTPHVDGFSVALSMDLRKLIRCIEAALKDLFRIVTLRGPYYVPIVGKSDTFAVLNSPDALSGYMALIPEGHEFKNECPARIFLTALFYRPVTFAKKVKCPALVVIAEKDSIINPHAVKKTALKMSNAALKSMPIGHFDVYQGEIFAELVNAECDFLKKYLKNS